MNRRTAVFVLGGLLVAFVLAFGVSRLASSQPDGLERVAMDKGINAEERDHTLADGPFADYSTQGVDDDGLGTGVAGLVGVVATFVVAGGAVWIAAEVRRPRVGIDAEPAPSP